MKWYKLSSVTTKIMRGGKRIVIKHYRNAEQQDSVVVEHRQRYVDLIHAGDNRRYSCLAETLNRFGKEPR